MKAGTLPARADLMARLARVVAAVVSHHVTQRGKARRFMLDCDADRKVYLDLLRDNLGELQGVAARLLPGVQSRSSSGCPDESERNSCKKERGTKVGERLQGEIFHVPQ
jgi:hypothetical protein